jgi:hypothetical protein
MSRAIAHQAAVAGGANAASGVVVQYRDATELYVIWSIGTNGLIQQHELDATVTDEARLTAHVAGFVQNHLAAWADHEQPA